MFSTSSSLVNPEHCHAIFIDLDGARWGENSTFADEINLLAATADEFDLVILAAGRYVVRSKLTRSSCSGATVDITLSSSTWLPGSCE